MNQGRYGLGKKGALPYTAVAVTILVVTAAWSAAVYVAQDGKEASEDVVRAGNKVEEAAGNTGAWIERGLGEIVLMVSNDPDGGTLEERAKEFGTLSDRWMKASFPAVDSGVHIEARSWNFDLTTALVQIGSSPSLEGYTPSFLKASGTVELVISADSGRMTTTIDVVADAGSALPLAAERGSLFDNAITGQGSILSQLMTYQLSSLAQYRIINGWGATTYYGDTGTASVITAEDVKKSYESCIRAVSSIYLHDDGEVWTGYTDAASVFVSEEKLVIDLNAVYAQALAGVVDEISERWFDYFGGGSFLSDLDNVADAFVTGWNSLVGFITGTNTDSAANYIRSVCGDRDYRILPGSYFTITDSEGNDISIPYPEADIMSTGAVNSFYSTYRNGTTGIKDWIASIVNRAVANIAESKSLGVLEFTISKDEDFGSVVAEKTLDALNGCADTLEHSLKSALSSMEYNDRMSEAMWRFVDSSKDSDLFYSFDSFFEACRTGIEAAYGEEYDEESARSDPSVISAWKVWREEVDRQMEVLRPLCKVASNNSDLLKEGCMLIITCGIGLAGLAIDIKPSINAVCNEFRDSVSGTGFSGTEEYPDGNGFELVSSDMSGRVELSLSTESDPSVKVGIDFDECIHSTGLNDTSVASHRTMWTISVRDSLKFDISVRDTTGTSGIDISGYSGKAAISLDLTVSAVSGWALYGVDYRASNTAQGDLSDMATNFLLSLVDPLIEFLKSMQEVIAVLEEAVALLCGITEILVEKVFETMFGPVVRLQNAVDALFDAYGYDGIMAILENIERTYNITLSSQTVTFTYGEWNLKTTFYLGTMMNQTKHVINATLSGKVGGADFSAGVDLKLKGSNSLKPAVTGTLHAKGDDWLVDGTVDPLMGSNDFMLKLDGNIRTTGFTIVIPEVNKYYEIDLSLADTPAGALLTNIPFIIPGTLVSLDAGVDLKYNAPVTTGVLINEAEANPMGTDSGNEWAEIINLTLSEKDVSGWVLRTSKGKEYTFPDGTVLSPGSRIVAHFTGAFLNNSSETLTLYDTDGAVSDKVSLLNDTSDDGRTCQRAIDGMTQWGLYEGTEGEPNKGGLFGMDGTITRACIDILTNSVKKAMSEMGGKLTSEEEIAEFIEKVFKYSLDSGIEEISSMLVEASIYVEVEFTDVSSSVTLLGFRVHLTADKDMSADLLRYILGNVANIVLGIDDPYNIDLGRAFMEDVHLGITFYTGYGLPSIIDTSGDGDIRAGIDVSVNLAGLASMANLEAGRTVVKAGIVVEHVPATALPSFMKADKKLSNNLWLIKVTLRPGGNT